MTDQSGDSAFVGEHDRLVVFSERDCANHAFVAQVVDGVAAW